MGPLRTDCAAGLCYMNDWICSWPVDSCVTRAVSWCLWSRFCCHVLPSTLPYTALGPRRIPINKGLSLKKKKKTPHDFLAWELYDIFSDFSSLKCCDPVTADVLGQLLRFLAVCVALPLMSYPWNPNFWHGKIVWLSCTARVSALSSAISLRSSTCFTEKCLEVKVQILGMPAAILLLLSDPSCGPSYVMCIHAFTYTYIRAFVWIHK